MLPEPSLVPQAQLWVLPGSTPSSGVPWGAPSPCHRREQARVGSAGLAGEGMFCTKLLFIARILFLWGNPQPVPGEQPRLQPQTIPSGVVWVFGTSPSQCHCTDTSLLPPAAAVPCWSCLCLSPACPGSPCLQPRVCQVCAVLVVPGELFPSLLLLWRAQGPAQLLPPWTHHEGSAGQTPHHSRSFGWRGSGAGALSDCRAGILRAGIVFYKKKISKEPPGRGAGDGCRGFL